MTAAYRGYNTAPIRCRTRRYILTADPSDAGAHAAHELLHHLRQAAARLVPRPLELARHRLPWTRGYILTADQSDAGST
eukprot:1389163-Pyramimonas_sp.AAC.1